MEKLDLDWNSTLEMVNITLPPEDLYLIVQKVCDRQFDYLCREPKLIRYLGQVAVRPKIQIRSTFTGSEETLTLAKKWISDCIENHHLCKAEQSALRRLPTRLVFVGSIAGLPVRICQTSSLPSDTRYMTLSHCWGKVCFLTLTTKNFAALQREIVLADLPATFQDAITFARYIGVDYLWIDSLCIIQDSINDWQKESNLMESVYSNGFCNIAATGASDGSGGCFFNRSSEAYRIPTIDIPQRESIWHLAAGRFLKNSAKRGYFINPGVYSCNDAGLWVREITQSVLCKRAWVIQERFLAKRVLYFSPRQIFFECNQLRACEACPEYMLGIYSGDGIRETLASVKLTVVPDDPTIDTIRSVLNAWSGLISNYSACALTYEKDRLIALAGLARYFQPFIGCRYLAGLWETEFVSQLLWENAANSTRSTTYQAPSWSWASRSGKVKFPREGRYGKVAVNLLDIGVSTVGGSKFGQVTSGFVKMVGCLIPIKLDRPIFDLPVKPPVEGGSFSLRTETYHSLRMVAIIFVPDIWGGRESLLGTFYCTLLIYTNAPLQGLVLRATGIEKGQYQRVGLFRSPFEKGVLPRAEQEERSKMTEDLYEAYNEETDMYTFTII
jgi:hypothetical protein